jgi:hypothetical protein
MLVQANDKYTKRVEGSKHFLNCPTHMLNHTLDCFYRQYHDNKEKAVEVIANYLKSHGYKRVKTLAKEFVK